MNINPCLECNLKNKVTAHTPYKKTRKSLTSFRRIFFPTAWNVYQTTHIGPEASLVQAIVGQ